MARFVRHESCPKCGSRDNFGRYDDGSGWCFGCGKYEGPSSDKFIPRATLQCNADGTADGAAVARAEGLTTEFPLSIISSLSKYDLSVGEILRGHGRYDASTDSLTFTYKGIDGTVVCRQRRSFRGRGPKYLSEGSTYEVMDINGSNGPPNIVITEDKLSAIKVGRVCDASPALGTQYQHWKLVELLKRGYKQVYVWLDRDKWREGMEICDKAKWLGLSARAVYSELDPKCYSIDEIKGYLI